MDPFETLGIEPRFDVDVRALEERHRELSRALHPDRYVGAASAERRMALNKAIEVNEAFRVVRDPIRRAEALLKRAGVAVGETAEPKPPPALLMEMMESREELAHARKERDAALVAKLGAAMRERQDAVVDSLRRAFEQRLADCSTLDKSSAEEARLDDLLPLVGELRYVRRFLDEVSATEEELSP